MALTDEAIGKIKEMIISGRVRPGEKLPREADLAAELGLSRNSLREAVKALTLVNVLDVRQGDGTYATSLAPSLLLEALSFIIDFHQDDTVLDFLEVRRILEPAATGLAALRMSPEEKAELGKILDAVTVESPVDDFVATDLEFHKKIGRRGQLGARVARRQHVAADGAGQDLAGHDRTQGAGAHAGRAPRHPQRDPVRRRGPGQVLGHGPRRRHRVVATHDPGRFSFSSCPP